MLEEILKDHGIEQVVQPAVPRDKWKVTETMICTCLTGGTCQKTDKRKGSETPAKVSPDGCHLRSETTALKMNADC